ncbi:MAG: tetratricopeptide repeat protein [Planctomycetota bacterium]
MFRSQVLWTSLFVATGLVGGIVYNWPSSDVGETLEEGVDVQQTNNEPASQEQGFSLGIDPFAPTEGDEVEPPLLDELTAEERASSQIAGGNDVDDLLKGDQLLTGGNYIGAYNKYEQLQREAGSLSDGSLAVRMGLASELGGFLEQAEGHYRAAIESPSSSLSQQLWALIGTARTWKSQGRTDEAISLLSELFLVYGNDQYPEAVRLPIFQHLTDCLQERQLAGQQSLTDSATPLHYAQTPVVIEPVLEEIAMSNNSTELPEGLSLKVLQRHPTIRDVSLIIVEVRTMLFPILRMLGELDQTIDIDMRVSTRARSILNGRSLRIDSTTLPIAMILDHVLGPLGLLWRQEGDVVYISHVEEMEHGEELEFELQRINRLLRQRKSSFSSGAERSSVLTQEANNLVTAGNLDHAANLYKSARDLRPTGEKSAMLYYNVGVMESMRGQKDIALGKFYQALDQTLAPTLQASSYAKIAELELELGRPERAIPAAARGRRLATEPDVAAKNLMMLSKAYLLESDPYSANQALFDHQPTLTDDSDRRLASVLGSYARFQVVKPVSGLQNEGERLVVALVALQKGDAKSFIDHLIVSRAFREVGFRSRAIEHLEVAAQQVEGGYWDHRVQLELGEILYQSQELEKSIEVLRPIVQMAEGKLRIRAGMLDARVREELGRYDECQQTCELLLQLALTEEQKADALELLGKAYEGKGQHYAAALCFAGLLPEQTEPSTGP